MADEVTHIRLMRKPREVIGLRPGCSRNFCHRGSGNVYPRSPGEDRRLLKLGIEQELNAGVASLAQGASPPSRDQVSVDGSMAM